MPDLPVIKSLLARIDAASGPDRELDARIWHAIAPDHVVLLDHGAAGRVEKRPPRYGPLSEFPIDGWDHYEGVAVSIGALAYTSSLDAAVALVERVFPDGGWTVARAHNCSEAEGKPFFADVASREFIEDLEAWGPSRGVIASAGGHTSALALCAALLRALIAQSDAALSETKEKTNA